jgi:hypothetical protein
VRGADERRRLGSKAWVENVEMDWDEVVDIDIA